MRLIDGYYLKSVILRDVQMAHNDGPLILDNAYFMDCNFRIFLLLLGQQFSASVLASAATTFRKSPNDDHPWSFLSRRTTGHDMREGK